MTRGNQSVARAGLSGNASDIVLLTSVLVVTVLGAGTWLTGELAALLFDGRWPRVSFASAVSAALRLPGHLGDPRQAWPAAEQGDLPGPVGFAVAVVLVLGMFAAVTVLAVRIWTRGRPQRGFASRADLVVSLAARAVTARAGTVRPSLAGRKNLKVTDAGVRIGRAVPSGITVGCSAEDSVLLLAAPRTGKTSSVVIPWLGSWPGPALVTSIRPDVLLSTARPRRGTGPVAVMAPTGMITWPDRLTWDLTGGCASFDKARVRADVMVTVGKSAESSDSTDGGYFAMSATNLLAGWLHAAALSGGSARDVVKWAFDERVDDPIRILASADDAADGTAAMMDALYRLPADTTRASLWTTAQTAIAPLLAPAARDTFMSPPGNATDLETFLRAGGTCYLMADERRATALAPIVSAFADDFIETAKGIADTQPGGRLDPPCGLFMDEVANIVPLPQLPALMSFAGGTGLFAVAVLQSLAQARNRWGQDAAAMLWGAATVKIVLGGLAGEDLREISELSGEYRETVITWQQGQGGYSVSSALQDRKTLTPEEVRTLRSHRREALVIHSTTPAVRVRMTRHYEGPERVMYAESEKESRLIAGLDQPVPQPRKAAGGHDAAVRTGTTTGG
jgi:type IV secretory pathway TraG/TraD family ATPase VirD4